MDRDADRRRLTDLRPGNVSHQSSEPVTRRAEAFSTESAGNVASASSGLVLAKKERPSSSNLNTPGTSTPSDQSASNADCQVRDPCKRKAARSQVCTVCGKPYCSLHGLKIFQVSQLGGRP